MMTIEWRTKGEAMTLLGLSHEAILQAISRGSLTATSLDGRILITSTSINRLVRSMQPANAEGRS